MSNRATFDQAYQMLNLAREADISLERFQALVATGILSDVLKVEDPTTVDREKFRVVLGYDPSVFRVKMGVTETTDQIVAYLKANGFGYVNELITQENFPLESGEITEDEIVIVDPGCSFSEEEGLAILKKEGLIRPTYQHALRFAREHGMATSSTRKPFVIFLHEPWRDPNRYRRVIYVHRHLGNRRLDLSYPGFRFYDGCVLAGVRLRKQS